jgi:hypothetical protein
VDAEQIMQKAIDSVMPSLTKTQWALCEQAMAKGIETAADTLRALAGDIVAGRAPVSDIKEAADYLHRIAAEKRREAAKILHPA